MHELFPDGPDYNLISQLTIPAEAPFSERPLAAFSGGERIKLLLLRTLMQGPDFLVLDEPTNDLDLRALDWLERLILSSKIPVLYVSHDETLLEHTANVILHFEQIRRKTAAQHTLERMGYRAMWSGETLCSPTRSRYRQTAGGPAGAGGALAADLSARGA